MRFVRESLENSLPRMVSPDPNSLRNAIDTYLSIKRYLITVFGLLKLWAPPAPGFVFIVLFIFIKTQGKVANRKLTLCKFYSAIEKLFIFSNCQKHFKYGARSCNPVSKFCLIFFFFVSWNKLPKCKKKNKNIKKHNCDTIAIFWLYNWPKVLMSFLIAL